MSEKTLKSRIVHKHDTETNWESTSNFTPFKGEIIIYDPDANNPNPRFKIGDGETLASNLPFSDTTYSIKKNGNTVTLTSSNNTTSTFTIDKELPTVTTGNNGDFLRVVNGAWAAATVPNAEEASF